MNVTPEHLEVRDTRFLALVHPMSRLEKIAQGFTWTEGPVWFGDHNCLLFSDIPSQRIMRWSEDGVSTFRTKSEFNNGNTRDNQGRLVGCRHGTRDVVRTELNGELTVLATSFQGMRLNSPNDVVVTSDGVVWFTDPTYGIMSNFEGYQADREQNANNVYRFDPVTNELDAVISDFNQPNGLVFSPDEKRLYVAESGSSHDAEVPSIIRQFDVNDSQLNDAGIFATIDAGLPDGMRVDVNGNLWSSAADGVHCFASDGTLLGKILVPETVSNLCFGGANDHLLYITATTSVYRVFVNTTGAESWVG